MLKLRIAGVVSTVVVAGAVGLALIASGAAATETKKGSPPRIAVDLDGTGSGQVVSTPSLIDCPRGRCVAPGQSGQQYTLRATPDAGSTLTSIAGPCDSATPTTCTFVAREPNYVFQVTFDQASTGGNTACEKAKKKLASAKAKLRQLRQSGASDGRIDSAKQKVKKAKKKKKKKCT